MRILWFNWRDIKHPEAGGAEVLTHEIMIRLAKMGHEMTLYCPMYPNALQEELTEGIKIIRCGGKYTVYRKAKAFYKEHNNSFDIVVDEINAKPFLSPELVRSKPILALFHQLIHDEWFYEVPFPLSYICYYYLEKKWLSSYKDIPTVTVSSSSERDLKDYGFRRTFVIPMGLSVKPLEKIAQKESEPTVLFIGRLKKHKLPDHALMAFSNIKQKIPNAKMWIIGDGIIRKRLERFHTKDVIFYGRIENELKYDLLQRAHVVLMPSVREGWGLVVTEANAMGTPVVAYDVPGLRDSVINGKTGMLLSDNTPECLADSTVSLLTNRDLLWQYSNNALLHSKQFSWDKTALVFENILKQLT